MRKLKRRNNYIEVILVISFFFNNLISFSQCSSLSEPNVLDAGYIQENIPTKRVVQYPSLREADVIWSKRIWRTIDLREKMNHPLFYPLEPLSDRRSLWDVIKCGVLNESSITIYELGADLDDQFKYPVKPTNGNIDEFKKKLNSFFGTLEEIPMLDSEDNFKTVA